MVQSTRPPANGFVASARKFYNPIGFSKGYNFILWFIFSGAFFGFMLSRAPFLNFSGYFCGPPRPQLVAGPGECFYYTRGGYEEVGIKMHLYTILPAGFLVLIQFIPIVRYKAILVHRLNGYLVVLLSVISTAAVFMIARYSFGGNMATQIFVGWLSILFLGSLGLAYYNVKRLQIEQHRAWMLRAWFYAGSIITLRLIMVSCASIISNYYGWYEARPCNQIAWTFKGSQNATLSLFPECASFFDGSNPDQYTLVKADFNGNPMQIAAALGISFGASGWLALAIHAIGIEIYLALTPAEHERLRNVSYQRQVEAGMRNPGRAGLTVDRFGDAEPWVPKSEYGSKGGYQGVRQESSNEQ